MTESARGLHLTTKQRQILEVIVAGNGLDAGGLLIPVDMNELLERLPYRTSKASMQFSIRALISRGFLAKGVTTRRGKERVSYIPQVLAFHVLGGPSHSGGSSHSGESYNQKEYK